MATRVENISSGKVIGFGAVNILPGETKTIPKEYENSPALKFYEDNGFARISRKEEKPAPVAETRAPEPPVEAKTTPTETETAPAESAEEPRKEKKTKSAAKS